MDQDFSDGPFEAVLCVSAGGCIVCSTCATYFTDGVSRSVPSTGRAAGSDDVAGDMRHVLRQTLGMGITDEQQVPETINSRRSSHAVFCG